MSRLEVARFLGKSKSAIRYHHGKGLTPVQNKNGEWRYEREQVERLAVVLYSKARKGDPKPWSAAGAMAREVFRRFRIGLGIAEIVQGLGIEPEQVLKWHAIYLAELPITHEPKIDPAAAAEIQLRRDELEHKRVVEQNRVDLAREKMHLTEQGRIRRDLDARPPFSPRND